MPSGIATIQTPTIPLASAATATRLNSPAAATAGPSRGWVWKRQPQKLQTRAARITRCPHSGHPFVPLQRRARRASAEAAGSAKCVT